MPRDEESLSWLDLDFGHGIWSADEVVSGHGAAPDGAATTDTYGCWSPPAGGLAPLPGESTSAGATLSNLNLLDSYLHASTAYEKGMDRVWLADGKVIGPTIATGSVAQTVPDVVCSMHAWVQTGNAQTDRLNATSLVRVVGYSPRKINGAATGDNYIYCRVGPSTVIQAIGYDTNRYVPVAVFSTRDNGPSTSSFGDYDTFPSESNPAGSTAYISTWLSNLGGWKYVNAIVQHQNRILALVAPVDSSYGFGPDGKIIGAEEIWYTAFDTTSTPGVPQPDTQGAWTGPVIVSEGDYSGYGAWASLNSNELLLVRHRGGAALIRGDITSPSITRLPGVEGTHGMNNIPAVTPFGVAYGSRSGFHLWSGNDTSDQLSPQLADDFWIDRAGWTGCKYGVEVEQYQKFGPVIVGRSTYRAPFLYAPNNYLCDLSSERRAWWRLTAQGQTPIYHWDTGTVGVWGFHGWIDAGGTYTRAATHFDPAQPTNIYYYETLPLTPTRGRYANVREIVLTCSGQTGDQITVRITGTEGTGGNTYDERTITLAASGTEHHRLEFQTIGTNLQVSVTATAAGASSNPAPRLHDLAIGYLPTAKVTG